MLLEFRNGRVPVGIWIVFIDDRQVVAAAREAVDYAGVVVQEIDWQTIVRYAALLQRSEKQKIPFKEMPDFN